MRIQLTYSICAILILATAIHAEELYRRPVVEVSGQGTQTVTPDQATLYFGVETRDASLDNAKSTSEATTTAVLAVFDKIGIESQYIKTGSLEIEPLYSDDWDDDGQPLKLLGFSVDRRISVEIHNLSLLDTIVARSLKAGVNAIHDIEFTYSKHAEAQKVAIKKACKDAREKAELLADALDMRVGHPTLIRHSDMSRRTYGGRFGGGMLFDEGPAYDAMTPLVTTFSVGQIAITANVYVEFDLFPKG